MKIWLREHRTHPYPSHEEKTQLAHQSSITYDQVTTWFNNARAILRRRHAKLRPSFEITEDDNHSDSSFQETKESSNNRKTVPNSVSSRSIGVQCSPSTAEQSTITSTELSPNTDRTIRILSPSSGVTNSPSHTPISNGISVDQQEQTILLTSTCLDEDQMVCLQTTPHVIYTAFPLESSERILFEISHSIFE